jgi:predicted alpha/beta superfamily hydrolase
MVQKHRVRFYAFLALALIGLVTAWWLNALAVLDNANYLKAWFGTPVDQVLSVDLTVVAIAVAIFMIYEAQRLKMKHVWAYIAVSGITAMAFSFPLFLAMRERKMLDRHLAGGTLDNYVFDNHRVQVWAPKNITPHTPVLVMHDGRNLFDLKDAFAGKTWEVIPAIRDEVRAQPPLLIGVWGLSDDTRLRELSPEKIVREDISHFWANVPKEYQATGTEPFGDSYVSLIADAILPFVFERYNIVHDKSRTAVMGSSMGGLMSLYAMGERPEVFGTAICFSTHWPFGRELMVEGLINNLPEPGEHRVWTDAGTIDLDQHYAPFHQLAAQRLRERGYAEPENLVAAIYPNTGHHESFWARRVADALNWWLKAPGRDLA